LARAETGHFAIQPDFSDGLGSRPHDVSCVPQFRERFKPRLTAVFLLNSKAEALDNACAFLELPPKALANWERTSEVFEMEEYG